jgi:ribA/ribD-fused uncharacterized protein
MRKTETHLFFWNGIYSQWEHSIFTETDQNNEELVFFTAEQYMMYHKAKLFGDMEIANKILETKNPRKCKSLGRKVQNFDEVKWNSQREQIVTQGNYLKFTQDDYLLGQMMKDKELILVEASPEDHIWGIGLHFDDDRVLNESEWQGLNLLGKSIMKARAIILKEQN